MKPINCALLVKTTKEQLDEGSQYIVGGVKLFRDKRWSDRTHQLQIVEVVGVNDNQIDGIQVGDKAIVHQQVTEESEMRKHEHQLLLTEPEGTQIRYCLHRQYFGRYNGVEIFPRQGKIFCDFVEEGIDGEMVKNRSGIWIPNEVKEERIIKTVVRYINDKDSEATTLKVGDTILAKEFACYDIAVDGKKFYMVDMLGLIDRLSDGELKLKSFDLIPLVESNG